MKAFRLWLHRASHLFLSLDTGVFVKNNRMHCKKCGEEIT